MAEIMRRERTFRFVGLLRMMFLTPFCSRTSTRSAGEAFAQKRRTPKVLADERSCSICMVLMMNWKDERLFDAATLIHCCAHVNTRGEESAKLNCALSHA